MIRRTACSFCLCLGLVLALFCLLGSQSALADAGIHYVAPAGNCGGATPCYATVQAAVDAATDGDEIRVAAGTYSDVNDRGGLKQVVYIDKTVTIRGGYSTADWNLPNPAANPATLDARRAGRVLYITGVITPTIEGLHVTGGDAKGLGGGLSGDDAGGGIYIDRASAAVDDSVITGNVAYRGGGLWLESCAARLYANSIISNTASWAGGGLWLNRSPALLHDNRVVGNDASYGGGLLLLYSQATLSHNAITGNRAEGEGGGASLVVSNATLLGNLFADNSVTYEGGGVAIYLSDATFVNNVIMDNEAGSRGSGAYIRQSAPHFLHTTIARNGWNTPGADGIGIYITGGQSTSEYYPSSLWMTNTVISSHTVGVMVTAGDSATLNTTMWYENTPNWAGDGTVESINGLRGMPMFAADGYHLRAISGAIDRAIDAGVTDDIDGEDRPHAKGYDLGADEYVGPAIGPALYLPLAVRG
jgi:hypothetical protein